MAIFMDRHDLNEGITAADVAEAHRKDLEIQDQYGVKFLTYWFDMERRTTFCLVDAPNREATERVHREAHGDLASDIIEVDLSAVEAFLGRIGDPAPRASSGAVDLESGFRAVMFTDIVGSTEMTARLGDVMAVEMVRAHDALMRRSLQQHGGREVKHTGDGIMASFEASPAAVDCAKTAQRAFADYNRRGNEPFHVRIGIHAGEPVAESNDLFGSTVQLASRICGAARPDRIVVSDLVRRACPTAEGFADLGPVALKGFAEPVRLFEVAWR